MTGPVYPLERVDKVLVRKELPSSCRVFPIEHAGTPLGTGPGDSRFCAQSSGFTVLYAAPDFTTAFFEAVIRDRFTRMRRRRLHFTEVTELAWTDISTDSGRTLSLIDLRHDGCLRIGAPTDTVRARSHTAGRAFGKAIYAEHPHIDGLLFSSRLTSKDVYAIFDRATAALTATRPRALEHHPELESVLLHHEIELEFD